MENSICSGGPGGSFSICYHRRFKIHRKSFWTFLDTFSFFPHDPPPSHSSSSLCTESWKFSKYFWTFKGKKLKSLRMSQISFLDNKKITEDFPYVGGGGRPTYGKFHMFRRFYFWKLPLFCCGHPLEQDFWMSILLDVGIGLEINVLTSKFILLGDQMLGEMGCHPEICFYISLVFICVFSSYKLPTSHFIVPVCIWSLNCQHFQVLF